MIVKVICWITSSSITYYSGKEIPSEQRPSRKEIPFGHLRHAERLLRSPTLGQLGSSVALGLGGAHTALVSGSQRCSYRGTWSTRALRSPAAPPTATPCKAPTETPSSTTGYLLTQRMNFPSLQPADTALYTGKTKLVIEIAYAVSIGIYEPSTRAYHSGCTLRSEAILVRRAEVPPLSLPFPCACASVLVCGSSLP